MHPELVGRQFAADDRFGIDDVRQLRRVKRAGVRIDETLQTEYEVLCADRIAVGPAGTRANRERVSQPVFGDFPVFCTRSDQFAGCRVAQQPFTDVAQYVGSLGTAMFLWIERFGVGRQAPVENRQTRVRIIALSAGRNYERGQRYRDHQPQSKVFHLFSPSG